MSEESDLIDISNEFSMNHLSLYPSESKELEREQSNDKYVKGKKRPPPPQFGAPSNPRNQFRNGRISEESITAKTRKDKDYFNQNQAEEEEQKYEEEEEIKDVSTHYDLPSGTKVGSSTDNREKVLQLQKQLQLKKRSVLNNYKTTNNANARAHDELQSSRSRDYSSSTSQVNDTLSSDTLNASSKVSHRTPALKQFSAPRGHRENRYGNYFDEQNSQIDKESNIVRKKDYFDSSENSKSDSEEELDEERLYMLYQKEKKKKPNPSTNSDEGNANIENDGKRSSLEEWEGYSSSESDEIDEEKLYQEYLKEMKEIRERKKLVREGKRDSSDGIPEDKKTKKKPKPPVSNTVNRLLALKRAESLKMKTMEKERNEKDETSNEIRNKNFEDERSQPVIKEVIQEVNEEKEKDLEVESHEEEEKDPEDEEEEEEGDPIESMVRPVDSADSEKSFGESKDESKEDSKKMESSDILNLPPKRPNRRINCPKDLSILSSILNDDDMKNFIMGPVPLECGTIQCTLIRKKSKWNKMLSGFGGANSKLYPEYLLYFKHNNKFIMAGKKRSNQSLSTYSITMSSKYFNKESDKYLGKLRSNYLGTEFVAYSDGKEVDSTTDKMLVGAKGSKKELACVLYESNILGLKGPRKMQACIPEVSPTLGRLNNEFTGDLRAHGEFHKEHEIIYNKNRLLDETKKCNLGRKHHLVNKPPRWNEQVGAYVLNFNGRVTTASIKNFQLVDPDDVDRVILQFGRTGNNEFSMDFQFPISAYQAFCIVMSSFDRKVACD